MQLEGSPFDERAIREWGPRDPAREREGLANLFRWCGRGGQCAGPGPLVLAFLPLALALPWLRRRAGRGLALVLTLMWALPILAFLVDSSPTTVQVRRAFPDHAPRYHAASLVLLAVCALAALPRRAWARRLANAALAGSALYGLRWLDAGLLHPLAELGLAVAPVALGVVAAVAMARVAAGAARLAVGGAVLAALGVWSALLQDHRERTRYEYFGWQRTVPHSPLPITAGAWRHCDRPERPQRLALAIGWWPGGMSWCLYPFYGSRLQNRVLWVPAERPWPYDAAADNGAPRAPGDYELWRANLRAARIDAIYLQLPEGEELRWTREHASDFAVEYAAVGHGVVRPVWRR
jgi:hypothetical protein